MNVNELTKNPLEESSVTMLDVLEEAKVLEEQYVAVYGASDDKRCTYSLGPIKRQALYSCLTCCPDGRNNFKKCAAICLACSYQCHENHDLIELYTKRNLRCDCPTDRIKGNHCNLNSSSKQPAKANDNNLYNQNFQGLYCVCHRPYPDPEQPATELMLQCIICEDWYHLQHLNALANAEKLAEACTEMICGNCMAEHRILHHYTGMTLKKINSLEDNTGEDNENKSSSALDKSSLQIMNTNEENGPSPKRQKLEQGCRKPNLTSDYINGPTFWGPDWRMALCQCSSCLRVYETEKIEYLLDPEDSTKSYEERGIEKQGIHESIYEQGIRALASIDRVLEIDFITEYNRMKDKLKDYLQKFAANKEVVTEEDIKRFFAEMRNEKKEL